MTRFATCACWWINGWKKRLVNDVIGHVDGVWGPHFRVSKRPFSRRQLSLWHQPRVISVFVLVASIRYRSAIYWNCCLTAASRYLPIDGISSRMLTRDGVQSLWVNLRPNTSSDGFGLKTKFVEILKSYRLVQLNFKLSFNVSPNSAVNKVHSWINFEKFHQVTCCRWIFTQSCLYERVLWAEW